jgi:uncharacterized membrane protein YgcG
MKKLFGLFFILLFVFSFISLPVSADVNDFVIKEFRADYYLSRDENGNSNLKTTETIIVEFKDYDQNRGIERALPLTYDGHSTSLEVLSIKNEIGVNWPYTTYRSNGNLVLRIGDANKYLRGTHAFVVVYTQKNVTKYFSDTDKDEFYWDVNGFGWSQKFEKVTANIHVDSDLIDSLSSGESCYYGNFGSDDKCDIVFDNDTYSVSVEDLDKGQNVTVVIGFKSGTFNPYKLTVFDLIVKYIGLIGIAMIVISFVAVLSIRLIKGKNAKGRGTIVPEYLPPKNADVLTSAVIKKYRSKWLAAMYVDMAVRHKIKIIELKKPIFGKNSYEVELLSNDKLTDNERGFLSNVFGASLTIGSKYTINPNRPDYSLAKKLESLFLKASERARADGYYRDVKKTKLSMIFVMVGGIVFAALALLLSRPGLTIASEAVIFVMLIFGFIEIFIIITMAPLADKGRSLFDYISGLKMYIKVAEEERLKYLQSVTGAEKVSIDDKSKLVKLYERVLPYAILLGIEKSWGKVIGNYYHSQNQQPDWYYGTGVFNAAVFASTVSSFSSSAISSNSYSSNSGGSGGGGFSGGGGGGGGGGGW